MNDLTPDALSEFSAILERVYDAALDPAAWPQALRHIADWLGATRALLFTPLAAMDDGGFFYSHGVSTEEMTVWSSRYVGTDFWTARMLERQLNFEGSVFLDGDLSTRTELQASPYYREHLTRMHIAWLLGGIVLAPADGSLPLVGCSMYRGVDADTGFDETARQRFTLLMPHLSRALGVMLRLREAELSAAANAAALDSLSCGVVLLDALGCVLQANHAAQQAWRRDDGLRCVHGRVQAADAQAQRVWAQALRATLANEGRGAGEGRVSHFSEAVKVPRTGSTGSTGDSGGYLLQLSRLPDSGRAHALHRTARVIVFITDDEHATRPGPEVLTRLYDLSPAEARTAQALGEGRQIAITAARLGLSPNTVKTHLKQIYAKTACSSRADLTRLLFSLSTITSALPPFMGG